jgi:peptide/nickel transport system substrate-binding protein
MKRILLAVGLVAATAWAAGVFTATAGAVTFRWTNDGDALSMDPYMVNETFSLFTASNIYDPLVMRDQNLKVRSALAESWKNTTPTTWELKLRKGVKFHDGADFSADDVLFSYHRVLSQGSDLKGNFANVVSIEAKDAHTIVITTKVPDPILLSLLTTWSIMSKEWAEKNNAQEVTDVRKGTENYATRNANGTGAYMLVSREADVKTVLKRNPNWWGWKDKSLGDGNVDEVVFTPIKQDATRVAALLSGDVDMNYNMPAQDVARVKSAGMKVYQGPELRTIFIGMDQKRDELLESDVKGKNPFKDKRVRLALYLAIDEDSIVSKIMQGAATPATGMVVKEVTGFDPKFKRLGYDPERAKKLLAEAGYPNGFSVGMDCPNDRYVNDALICQAVVSMWAKIGVNAKLLAQPKAQYFPKILSRNTSLYMLGWTPVTIDGLDALDNLLLTPGEKIGRFNLGSYSNPKVDEWANEARLELNAAKRTKHLQDALDLAHSDVGSIPLHYQQVIWASSAKVDLTQLASNYFEFFWVKVKP